MRNFVGILVDGIPMDLIKHGKTTSFLVVIEVSLLQPQAIVFKTSTLEALFLVVYSRHHEHGILSLVMGEEFIRIWSWKNSNRIYMIKFVIKKHVFQEKYIVNLAYEKKGKDVLY